MEEAQVASLADAARVQFSVGVLTVGGQLEPPLRMVAISAEALGVVGGICVLALRHFALGFLCGPWLLGRSGIDSFCLLRTAVSKVLLYFFDSCLFLCVFL